jgi:hypothetical protein
MLPLIVSDQFIPSGYMGDGTTPGAINLLPQTPADSQTCNGNRSMPALGICYTVTYAPIVGGMAWGGVYWQYPQGNWGASPGLSIQAGATQVTVWAKGGVGGEVVTFVAGGIMGAANADTFNVSSKVTLTAAWAQYSVKLPAMYGPVLGGFAWSAAAPAGGRSVSFSVDSIEWH